MQNLEHRRGVLQRPYLIILGAAVGLTMVLEGWALMQEDRLVINQALLAALPLLPLLVGLTLWAVSPLTPGGKRRKWWNWLLHWIGGTAAVLVAVVVVHLAWVFMFPYHTAVASNRQTLSVADAYNYRHFGYSFYVRGKQRRVAEGQHVLDETLTNLQGNRIQLSSLWQERPIVVEFGSITCPVFCGKIASMEELARKYAGKANFYVLYVREAHPGQNYPAHRSFTQKLNYAHALERLEKVERTILIYDLEGTMNRDYGAMPNSVYVIGKDGIIAYRADWNDLAQVERTLEAVLGSGGNAAGIWPTGMQDNFVKVDTGVLGGSFRVLRRSGFAAVADFVMSFPSMSMGRVQGGRSRN
ncbi:MAG: redoxin domain-containing protein [Acidobacteria bacterium]|nr:redoxin domain-containing protein [Acidobacteriota bacterium]